jgi:hypothetical protein
MEEWMSGKMRFYCLLVAAIALGLLIAFIDSSPGWDDTGISAGMIFLASALFGAISPERAWLWALAVGSWIPFLSILHQHNYGAFLALAFAFPGAYAGALLRKLASRERRAR